MISKSAIPLLTPVLLAALGTPLAAQRHLYTPPAGTDREGPDSTFIFGWGANQGQRFMDNNHTGTPRAIKGVSFRPDHRNHDALGRTWSKVEVWVAHGVWSSIQYNKANAYRLVDTPIKVFDKQWSWPTLKGTPPLRPASWGGVQNSLSFQFSKPWNYNGKDAIFLEFKFSGGRAHNNQPWKGGTPKGFEYHLDTMPQSMWRGSGGGSTFPARPRPCYDSASSKVPARLEASLSTGSSTSLTITSYYTSKTSPVLHAIGLGGNPTGLDLGAGCNLFYLSVTHPRVFLALPAPTDKIASARTSVTTGPLPSLEEVWVQAGWLDTTTKSLKLTHARRVTPGGGIIPAATSYTTGGPFNVWTAAAKGMPYMRYDY